MLMNLTIQGAYGRRYKTREAVLADWELGLDFRIWEYGQYCSIRDFTGPKNALDTPYFRQLYPVELHVKLPRIK